MATDDDLSREVGEAGAVREVFDAAPEILVSVRGPDFRFEAVNAGYRTLYGRSDLIGMPLREAFPEMAGQQVFEVLERAYRTGEPQTGREWRFEMPLHGAPPGEVFLDFVVVVSDPPGGGRRLVACLTDATERVRQRRAAERLAAGAERRLAAAREVVAALQEALLSTELPVLPGVAVGARYLVAAQDQAAGGDWFDAVPRPDGTLALVIGDVVGHGVAASAAMGRGAAVLRELLLSQADPGEALRRLDAFAARDDGLRAATVCLALLDPAGGALRLWSHGHPRPLVVTAAGESRFLATGGSGPLGTGAAPAETADRLDVGDTVVLYSDGLIERPGRTPQEGMAELARVARDVVANLAMPATVPGDPVDRLCQIAVELLTRTGYADDVTVLACRRPATPPPGPFAAEVPSTLEQVVSLRRALMDWLRAVGASADDLHVLELTVQEAMSNAVEHGGRGMPDTLRLEAAFTPDGWVECRVTSQGPWRPPAPAGSTRGRGLFLMQELSDGLQVVHPPQPAGAAPGSAGTVVILRRRLRKPAMLASEQQAAPAAADVPFAISTREGDGTAEVAVDGPIDGGGAEELRRELSAGSRGGVRDITVDLSGVTLLASGGVRVLHELDAQLASNGASLAIVAPSGGPARMVLDLVGLGDRVVEPART